MSDTTFWRNVPNFIPKNADTAVFRNQVGTPHMYILPWSPLHLSTGRHHGFTCVHANNSTAVGSYQIEYLT